MSIYIGPKKERKKETYNKEEDDQAVLIFHYKSLLYKLRWQETNGPNG